MSYQEHPERWIRHARTKSATFYPYLERPAMRWLLPKDLSGTSVLCLGVGSGEETEMYESLGAETITGIDNAPKLIAAARQRYPQHTFEVMDLNHLKLEGASYNVIGSSMALHYLPDWDELFKQVHAALKPGGIFLFSTHNPVWWSAEKIHLKNGFGWVVGVETDTKKHSTKALGTYLEPRKMKQEIFKGFEVEFYHRPFSEMVNDILRSDLELDLVYEPRPIEDLRDIDPQGFKKLQKLSPIILFRLLKKQ